MLQKIAPGIYYLPNEEETDRPILGYIQGEKYALLVDAGNSPAHLEKMMGALRDENLSAPDMVALTHWHWDHTFGLCAFKGISFASKLTFLQLKTMKSWKWNPEDMAHRLQTGEEIVFCHEHMLKEYEDPTKIQVVLPTVQFEGKMVLDLGKRKVILEQVGGPHSEDSIWVYLPEEKIYFVGDADSEDFYGSMGDMIGKNFCPCETYPGKRD